MLALFLFSCVVCYFETGQISVTVLTFIFSGEKAPSSSAESLVTFNEPSERSLGSSVFSPLLEMRKFEVEGTKSFFWRTSGLTGQISLLAKLINGDFHKCISFLLFIKQ
jgi:hypothetical protein